MNGLAPKRDGSSWQPWDVFEELEPPRPETETNAILLMFQQMAASQTAAEKAQA